MATPRWITAAETDGIQKVTVTLTDEQIRSDARISLVVGLSNKLLVPIFAIIQSNVVVAYDSFFDNCAMIINTGEANSLIELDWLSNSGSDGFTDVTNLLNQSGTFIALLGVSSKIASPGDIAVSQGVTNKTNCSGQDIFFQFTNGSALTLGSSSNTIKVTVYYATLDLS